MKKTVLLSLLLFGSLTLIACDKKSEENVSDASNGVVVSQECINAVEKYLEGVDKEGQGEEIKVGDNIVVDYIGRLEDGTVFDTSIEAIAKDCGKYSEGRDYTQGLPFEVGAGQMIKGFDNGVVGMKLGQTKTVKFGPDEGYGQRNEQYVFTYTKEDVGGDLNQYQLGGYFCMDWYNCGIIVKITDKELVVDYNHELAGKTLIFDITIKSIN